MSGGNKLTVVRLPLTVLDLKNLANCYYNDSEL
jgi:hypothetical protein